MNFLTKNAYKRFVPWLKKINDLEPQMARLSDSELAGKTEVFRKRCKNGKSPDALLAEAFAVVREAAKRVIGHRHEDVQIIGGIALHFGKIAEMTTGEGKTLTAVLPAYLNGLGGQKVHVVTSNEYLAKRDRLWMGPIYEFLGMRVEAVLPSSGYLERQKAYEANITYGSYNEFIFDYLRDSRLLSNKDDIQDFMNGLSGIKTTEEQLCQKGLAYAIIDEIDSILIDAGIQPLSISESIGIPPDIYIKAMQTACALTEGIHFSLDEKKRRVDIFPEKIDEDGKLPLELIELGEDRWENYIRESLRALHVMEKDREYLVLNQRLVVVDPFTGRAAPNRSFGGGLQQSLEVKEHLPISAETRPVLSTTYPLYFSHYAKLAGMTGTAKTEAKEFKKVLGLEVISIPTFLPTKRQRCPDSIYATEKEKMNAIVRTIREYQKEGRPVLVGTNSVFKCEEVSQVLSEQGIEHHVLSARHHEKEAEIIAQAGQKGRVTVVTNMAGRGVDIVLGEGVAELGGLHVISTEHHDSKRIDDQLFGRAGRRGDPGSGQCFVSLDDDLFRIFRFNKKVQQSLLKVSKEKDETGKLIRPKSVEKRITEAQSYIQRYYFQLRKGLIKQAEQIRKWRESDRYDPLWDQWSHFVF